MTESIDQLNEPAPKWEDSQVPQESDPQGVIPPIPPTTHKKTPFLLVFLLPLSVVAVFAIYLFIQVRTLTLEKTPPPTPTPIASADPTVGWKTYTDSEFNFSIQYPGNWYFEKGHSTEILFNLKNYLESQVTEVEIQKMNLGSDKIDITFGRYPNKITKSKDLTNWLKENDQYVSDMSGPPKLETKTLIAGNDGLIITYDGTGDFYVFKGNDHVFYAYFNPDNSEFKSTFDQVLSTVKFTNPSTGSEFTCPANGWQNCMPMLSKEGEKACSEEAMAWYKANCPDFQGAAL